MTERDWWDIETEYDLHRWEEEYDFDAAWERYRKRKEEEDAFLGKHDRNCSGGNNSAGIFTDVH